MNLLHLNDACAPAVRVRVRAVHRYVKAHKAAANVYTTKQCQEPEKKMGTAVVETNAKLRNKGLYAQLHAIVGGTSGANEYRTCWQSTKPMPGTC